VLIVFGMTLVMVIGRRLLHERQAALR
jgi:hypothetical protein